MGKPAAERRGIIRLRRRPRLRAETVACMGPFGEDRHCGVQARAWPVGLHFLRVKGETHDKRIGKHTEAGSGDS
jgi:hypothetical protein